MLEVDWKLNRTYEKYIITQFLSSSKAAQITVDALRFPSSRRRTSTGTVADSPCIAIRPSSAGAAPAPAPRTLHSFYHRCCGSAGRSSS